MFDGMMRWLRREKEQAGPVETIRASGPEMIVPTYRGDSVRHKRTAAGNCRGAFGRARGSCRQFRRRHEREGA